MRLPSVLAAAIAVALLGGRGSTESTAPDAVDPVVKKIVGAEAPGPGVPAMPPITTEVLTPAARAVVTRRVGGGLLP